MEREARHSRSRRRISREIGGETDENRLHFGHALPINGLFFRRRIASCERLHSNTITIGEEVTVNANIFLSDAQFSCQAHSCEYCENKPCKKGCPVDCSPADFIMAARGGADSDIQRAAAEILLSNPIGGVCGLICPNTYCQGGCSHKAFDGSPIEIPKMQAYIIARAK